MSIGRIFAFALLAAGLGAYIGLVERPRMADEGAPDLLVRFDVDDAARLALTYTDAPQIVLERVAGRRWRIVEPVETGADQTTVERLLTQIAEATAKRRIDAAEAEDPATYGLDGDGERARISIRLADGTDLPDIFVGRTTPVGYMAFARVEGNDDVIVTPLIFHTGVKKTLFELRDKTLLDFDVASAIGLTVTAGDTVLELVRNGATWSITRPFEARADSGSVRSLISGLASLQALEFYGDTGARDVGLDADAAVARIRLADGTETGVRVGPPAPGAPPGVYVERLPDGLVAKAPEWLPAHVISDGARLRDRRLFVCEPEEVARIRFQHRDGPSFSLVVDTDRNDDKDGRNWQIDPPTDRAVSQSATARRSAALAGLSGEAIVMLDADDATIRELGLETPAVVVEIERADASSCGRVRAGRVESGSETGEARYYLQRIEDGAVLSIPQYLFSRLDAYPEEFLVAEPPAVPAPPE
jgi:hypothetical protein